MNILMTGGGTAGHVNPAIAIADTIKAKYPDAHIAFAASTEPSDKAKELLSRTDYQEFYSIDICGMRSPAFHPGNLRTAFLMVKSQGQAKKLIKEFSPDLIIGTGGYASWPLLSVGADMGVPTLVHESNALPGKALMQVRGKVDRILVNFPEAAELFGQPDKTRVVGNPLLHGFTACDEQKAKQAIGAQGKFRHVVLAVGGSRGAMMVNRYVFDMIGSMAKAHPDVLFVTATGKNYYAEYKEKYAREGLEQLPNVRVSEYIYDMPVQMAAADVVISRAGAMTVSELALMRKAAILIPSPNVANDHQYKNAKALGDAGAAVYARESEFANGGLQMRVELLLGDAQKRADMRAKIAGFARVDANDAVLEEVEQLLAAKEVGA